MRPFARERGRRRTLQIDTICLDAGGVLVWPNWWRISDALRAEGVEVDPAALAEADPHARHELDAADVIAASTDQRRGWRYFDLVLKHAAVPLSDSTDAALASLQEYHRSNNLWETVPAFVPRTLRQLRESGYRMVVVSNANGTLRDAFARLGLAALVDLIVDSAEEGVEKPDPRLFEIALERVASQPATTLHVGDFYHIDVLGARAAGLTTVLVDAAALYSAADCHRIQSIAELPLLLQQLRTTRKDPPDGRAVIFRTA